MASPESAPQLLDRPNQYSVLIGRGNDLTPEVGALVLGLTGIEKPSTKPNMLIVPTPAPSKEYYDEHVGHMKEIYEELGANVSVLNEFGETPSDEHIKEAFGDADAFGITGGSTVNSVKEFMKPAFREAILNFRGRRSGGSAGLNVQATGSLSWYTPNPEKHPEQNEWIDVEGVQNDDGRGSVDAYVTPHADFIEGNFTKYPGENLYRGKPVTEPRSFYHTRNFLERLRTGKGPRFALAVDDGSSIAFDGSAFDGKGGFMVRNQGGAIKQDGTDNPVGVTSMHERSSGLIVVQHHLPTETFQPIFNLTNVAAAAA